jgi:hypothetical protein
MNSAQQYTSVRTSTSSPAVTRNRPLRELLKAYRHAQALGISPWEFAVGVPELRHSGLTETDLRWLVEKGYAEHGTEATCPQHEQRTFQRAVNLQLSEQSCFILTAAGARWAAKVAARGAGGPAAVGETNGKANAADPDAELPSWDAAQHTLSWRGQVVKRFKEEAPCQEAILSAFQAANWEDCIEVVLPQELRADVKRRLRDAVRNLNRSVRPHLHFSQEGCGSRVRWRPRGGERATQTLPKGEA